jgi:uncharacterized membrane protein YphA (DoxX/SURF4 family)
LAEGRAADQLQDHLADRRRAQVAAGIPVFAYLVAAAETLIAIAVLAGFARKITYIAAAAFSVLIWAVAEGFGGPYTPGASDVGTAVIYAVVFVGLLALMACTGTARYSVDYYTGKEDLLVVAGRRAPSAERRPERPGRSATSTEASNEAQPSRRGDRHRDHRGRTADRSGPGRLRSRH